MRAWPAGRQRRQTSRHGSRTKRRPDSTLLQYIHINLGSSGVDEEFWKDKKVLVTGHTGFKGSWLTLWLQHLGSRVVGFSLAPPTSPAMFEVADVANGISSNIGDVRRSEMLEHVFEEHQPEIVIHMAAQSLVQTSYVQPVDTFTTNVIGTVNILEAIRSCRCVRVAVFVTSDKCYENREWVWKYREQDRLGGRDPYSSSKACAELVLSAYRSSYFSGDAHDGRDVAVASVRAGNVIGGGDWAKDRLIPDIVNAMVEGRPAIIRNPASIRPWQHVLDPLSGYLQLAEKLWAHGSEFAESWNFGPNDEEIRPVSWIADYLVDSWGSGARWEQDSARRRYEAKYLKLDCSRSQQLLGWAPRLRLSTALDWVIDWYRAFTSGENMRRTTEAQIGAYTESMRRLFDASARL